LSASVEGAMAEFTDLTTRDATEQEAIVKRQLVAAVPADNLGAQDGRGRARRDVVQGHSRRVEAS
jgi:hypothetical protein